MPKRPGTRDNPAMSQARVTASLVAALALLMAPACGAGAEAPGHAGSRPQETSTVNVDGPTPSNVAFVRVTLATLWTRPGQLRPMDAPSASRPVDIPLWLSRMTVSDRAWLVGRLETQAAYGTEVTVLRRSGNWVKVAVHGQRTPRNRHGYPGWMPLRQLTWNRSLLTLRRARPIAVVTRKIAWLRSPDTLARRLPVPYATRLTILGSAGSYDIIATPGGGQLAIGKRSVAQYTSAAAIPRPTGRVIVAAAKRFLGLQYLWAGTSSYGFDCSGFTYIVFRRFGISLPRDADRQAVNGAPVTRSNLGPGDLVFFAGAGGTGVIHHVGIYAGSGMMIQSPHTGAGVDVVPLASMGDTYAGARRYL